MHSTFGNLLARLRDQLISHFIPAEIRNAAKTSVELLRLYHTVAAGHPDLTGDELYRQILRVRANGDSLAADTALKEAEESFAMWPVPRALRFRDVVNYVVVSDIAAQSGKRWTHYDLRRAVAARIPDNL
jgi:hypothetical protein